MISFIPSTIIYPFIKIEAKHFHPFLIKKMKRLFFRKDLVKYQKKSPISVKIIVLLAPDKITEQKPSTLHQALGIVVGKDK